MLDYETIFFFFFLHSEVPEIQMFAEIRKLKNCKALLETSFNSGDSNS